MDHRRRRARELRPGSCGAGGCFSLHAVWRSCVAVLSLVASQGPPCEASPLSTRPPTATPQPQLPPGASESMAPLAYLGLSVAGAVVSLDAHAVREYDGEDKDEIEVDLEGQGPTLFSLPRWNQGDYAPRLQPRRPFSQTNLAHIMPFFIGSAEEDAADIPAQAWRPSIEKGVILGSVAQNGRQWNDSSPLFYGTVACVYASHGFGYSMDTGEFSNTNPNIDIAVGKLGLHLEANVDAAIAWFPYHQGWVGGYVDAPGEYSPGGARNAWTSRWSFSPGLPKDAAQVLRWDGTGARLQLPGVNAARDGMLFLTSTNPGPSNNDVNVVSTFVDGRAWRVQVREDDQPIPSLFCLPNQAMFAFVYVPYSAGGLIGGLVSGSSGRAVQSRGSWSSERVSQGVYHLCLLRPPGLAFFQPQEPLSNRDGMLLLQVVGHDPVQPKFSRHSVLSYHILPNGTVRVENHRLERPLKGFVQDETYPATDTDFYFAWVDFRAPLTPTPEAFTGRLSDGDLAGPSFHTGLSAGFWALTTLALLGLLALFLALRLKARSSVLALAPLPGAAAQEPSAGASAFWQSQGSKAGPLHQLLPEGLRSGWAWAGLGGRGAGQPRMVGDAEVGGQHTPLLETGTAPDKGAAPGDSMPPAPPS